MLQVPGEQAGHPVPSPWLRLADPPEGFQTQRRRARGLRSTTATADVVTKKKKSLLEQNHSMHDGKMSLRWLTLT